ncbi:MAG: hypothetical protein PHC97_04340 [Patescibacteria group bacterium]|nr:hypothetical protein [Patescibacteria group bacterium]
MSRVNEENPQDKKVSDLELEMERLKRGLKRKQNKRILSCTSCFLFFLVILIVFAGFFSYGLAKSGLVTIPILSQKIYTEPRPTYIVQTQTLGAQTDFLSVFKDELTQAATNPSSANIEVPLQITDSQLSDFARSQILQNSLSKRVDYLQIAVLPQNLEIFIKLKNPKNVFLVLEVTPSVINKKINLKVNSFKIGNLQLPAFVGNLLISQIGGKILEAVLSTFSSFAEVESIKLDLGKILITTKITNPQGLF